MSPLDPIGALQRQTLKADIRSDHAERPSWRLLSPGSSLVLNRNNQSLPLALHHASLVFHTRIHMQSGPSRSRRYGRADGGYIILAANPCRVCV